MHATTLLFIMALATGLLAGGCKPVPQRYATEKPKPDVSFKPKEVTDALHGVIAADRAMYAKHVLQRLKDAQVSASSKNWREDPKALPLHADMLKLASHEVQTPGAEFHYALRSLRPLNRRNLPQTEIEKAGLEFIAANPKQNFYSEESLGGRRYFTAVYPDMARWSVCVECHNTEAPDSTPRKLNDVLGGIVVRVPLEF